MLSPQGCLPLGHTPQTKREWVSTKGQQQWSFLRVGVVGSYIVIVTAPSSTLLFEYSRGSDPQMQLGPKFNSSTQIPCSSPTHNQCFCCCWKLSLFKLNLDSSAQACRFPIISLSSSIFTSPLLIPYILMRMKYK